MADPNFKQQWIKDAEIFRCYKCSCVFFEINLNCKVHGIEKDL